MKKVLPKNFYFEEPQIVGKNLLGKYLVRRIDDKFLVGKIVEVEAYLAKKDEASHAFRGETKRTKSLFGDGGRTYIYSIHQQKCLDITTQELGNPTSVLIRALEPIEGIEIMQKFRPQEKVKNLTNGPGKLCQALNITRELDGIEVCEENSEIFITEGEKIFDEEIVIAKRVGISKAKDFDLRFYIKNNQFISKK